mmetsp:Transcript_9852/g.16577  ORF Transcript_9852/g.16577 Transcript_9852/m.16577 type:complete len:103 (+) Transcript_9852:117-425(+)
MASPNKVEIQSFRNSRTFAPSQSVEEGLIEEQKVRDEVLVSQRSYTKQSSRGKDGSQLRQSLNSQRSLYSQYNSQRGNALEFQVRESSLKTPTILPMGEFST